MFAFAIPTDRDNGSNQRLCIWRYRCWQHRVVAWVSLVTWYDFNLDFAKIKIKFSSSIINLYHILLLFSKSLPGSVPQTSKAPMHWWSKQNVWLSWWLCRGRGWGQMWWVDSAFLFKSAWNMLIQSWEQIKYTLFMYHIKNDMVFTRLWM